VLRGADEKFMGGAGIFWQVLGSCMWWNSSLPACHSPVGPPGTASTEPIMAGRHPTRCYATATYSRTDLWEKKKEKKKKKYNNTLSSSTGINCWHARATVNTMNIITYNCLSLIA